MDEVDEVGRVGWSDTIVQRWRMVRSVNALVDAVVADLGGLHIAFNNAGIPTPILPTFDELTPEIWRNVIDVNLTGTYLCMRAEVPALRASGGTAIVNTASIQSLRASAGQAGYIASKHGVAGLTKAVALDVIGDGIRVNAVCPGFIMTPMMAPAVAVPEVKAMLEEMAPIHRIAEADEVARAVLFLASDEASYCVGSLLSVDGGLAVVRGTLAPDGAIVKVSAASSDLLVHRGRAVVFDDMDDARAVHSFGDHAYRRFVERIKNAVDPNGIIMPGRHGIWPTRYEHMRHVRED